MKRLAVLSVLVLIAAALRAQTIEVNRTNKTIAVTAEDSIYADPDIAMVKIACHSFAPTKDTAYRDNLKLAEAITTAMEKANIPRAAIETSDISLERVDPETNWTPEIKRDRQYKVHHAWTVKVSAASAQNVIALAVAAGANEVEEPEWEVSDAAALQAKAGAAALKKARGVADQMAQGLGTKLGELVYASNRAPVPRYIGGLSETVEVSASGGGGRDQLVAPSLKLYPKRVKADATVYAIFAIQ